MSRAPASTAGEEFSHKHQRLISVLEETGTEAIMLTSAGALSWLLVGARVHVSLAGPPIVRALAHRGGVELAVFSNEAERFCAEELGSLTDHPGLRVHQLAWYQNIDDVDSWLPTSFASVADEASAALPLRAARASLLVPEAQRYRSLCQEAAAALTRVLKTVSPQTTERQLTASLAEQVIGIGAEPVVLLANGDSRPRHRHPLPTEAPLGRRAMAVVCARRNGLIANVSRWVCFGGPLAGEQDFDRAILEVEADVFDVLAPGVSLERVLETLKASYPRHGFDAEEWTRHHQGGAAGYQGRDPRASPGVADLIHQHQAFAWNPTAFDEQLSLSGKVEDTILLRADAGGSSVVEVLSTDQEWPTAEVRGRRRPLPLYR